MYYLFNTFTESMYTFTCTCRFSNGDVILSEEQANLLLTDLPTSPQKAAPLIEPNPANVSLGRLVIKTIYFQGLSVYNRCITCDTWMITEN